MEGGVIVIILFDEEAHLTKSSLKAFKEGALMDKELILVAEHVSACEKCGEALANSFNDNELAEVPLGFEEEIKSKIKKKKEGDLQLVFYSIRVAIAACMALVFVFSNTLNFTENTKVSDIKPINLNIVNLINTDINNFSQKIINMEVFNNEKEKK